MAQLRVGTGTNTTDSNEREWEGKEDGGENEREIRWEPKEEERSVQDEERRGKMERDEDRARNFFLFMVCPSWYFSGLVAARIYLNIWNSERAPTPPRERRETETHSPSSLVSFYIFLSRMIIRQNARVCSREYSYVFGSGQSRRSIVRRCIILLGAKGDDFITDPGNHSPKLTLFSVKAILVPPSYPRSSILSRLFPWKVRERSVDASRVFLQNKHNYCSIRNNKNRRGMSISSILP